MMHLVLKQAGQRSSHRRPSFNAQGLGRGVGALALGLVALALLATPQQGQAQTYTMRMEPVNYEVMPSSGFPGGEAPVILGTTSWGGSAAPADVTLPFTFNFYGVPYNQMKVHATGLVIFGPSSFQYGTGFTNIWTIDNPAAPNNMISMWGWNLVLNSGPRVQTQVLGTAPNRKFVLDYPNMRGFNLSGMTTYKFQLWLSEDSDDIEIRYGPDPGSGAPHTNTSYVRAMIGVKNADGTDYTPGHCHPNVCHHVDFPENQALIFSPGAQVRVSDLEGPEEGFAGIAFPLSYKMENPGSKPAANFTVQYWVSTEPQLTNESISLGYDDRTWTLDPRQKVDVQAEPRLPIELEEGLYYVIVEADPHHAVDISNRGGTIGVFGPFPLGIRAPNLAVPWVSAADLVKPGQVIDVDWIAENSGNLVANAIGYRLLLERTRFPSIGSPTIGGGLVNSLDIQEQRLVRTKVTIPPDTEPGIYYVGVEVNPSREIFEHERRDNFGISLPIVVSEEDMVVVTEGLPDGHIHGHYEVRLVAAGGGGIHHWSVREGTVLPPGLRLESRESELGTFATFLTGQPSAVGTFPISLVVRAGGLELDADFELTISSAEHALSVATESLAEASFGFAYQHELAAMGGKPPYSWEVTRDDALPHGVFLRSDGVLSGRPMQDGSFTIPVRVSDTEGRQTTKEFELNISPPATLTCVTQELPVLEIDEFVQVPLIAAGGKKRGDGTYLWTEHSLMRLAQELGESSGPVVQDFGLQLDPDGRVHGMPKLFGTFLWTVQVTDDTPGAQGIRCPILVRIPRDRGLTVVTQQLPSAVAGRSYRAQLDASGGDGNLTWTEVGSGRLLDELKLSFDATGNLAGTPSLDALQGEDEREFSLTVRVEDEKGRIGIGVVSLTLKGAASKSKGDTKETADCQTGGGAPAAWMIALLGLALLRRRR